MRRQGQTFWAVATMLTIAAQLSACGARASATDLGGSRSSRPDSGISGRVLLGPTCTSASTAVGLTTWTSTAYSATSLALSLPTTIHAPKQTGEIYHLDLIWTLNTGP